MLPFANLSADQQNEYFSEGLAEEIIKALTKLLNPGDAHLGIVHACFLISVGQAEEGLAKARRAWLAVLCGAIGELDRAFALLDSAFQERDSFLVWVRRMGLPD
jgi:hypothetical protein